MAQKPPLKFAVYQWRIQDFRKGGSYVLGPSINELVTDENIELCFRGSVLALFQSTKACKIDSNHTQVYKVIPGMHS